MSEIKEKSVATDVAVVDKTEQELMPSHQQRAKSIASFFNEEQLSKGDMSRNFDIPDDEEYDEIPVELGEKSWNLDVENGGKIGDFKTFIVLDAYAERMLPSKKEGREGILELVDGVLFATKEVDEVTGEILQANYFMANAFIKSIVRNAVSSGKLLVNNSCTKIKITFTGEKKNKTNSKKSYTFSSKVLVAKGIF